MLITTFIIVGIKKIIAAARKEFKEGATYNYLDAGLSNRPQGLTDRSAYIRSEQINVYPDTLAWIHDYAYSFNDPLTEKYFWHVAYDNYPVVGVNWNQAKAFCVWRTEKLNRYINSQKGELQIRPAFTKHATDLFYAWSSLITIEQRITGNAELDAQWQRIVSKAR